MANLIGFIDETGILQKDPNQRFFGLGLLKLEQTAPLYEELVRLKNRTLAKLTRLEKPFEFKFNDINRTNFQYYRSLLDLYFSFPQGAFCGFVIDKQSSNFQMEKFFGDTWEAYIGYSRLVIGKNVGLKDKICVLADFLSKPNSSTKFYEVEVAKPRGIGRHPVYNACMLESHASLFIQLVDVLIGAVVFDFRMKILKDFVPNEFKRQLVELLRKKLKVESLAGKFTKTEPNCFSVWPFKMDK